MVGQVLISIVIPCYKSAQSLPELIRQINGIETSSIGKDCQIEVIMVVDGSPDDTLQVAIQLAEVNQNLRVLGLTRNFGQHNAIMAGLRSARGEIIVTLDDDLQHRPNEIPNLIAPITKNSFDLVYGVPWVEEHNIARSFASRMIKKMLRASGVTHAEFVGAFRAFRATLINGFANVSDSNVNVDVLLSWTTTRVVPVKVHMDHRQLGKSSYNLAKLLRHSLNMITGYGVGPLKLATLVGFGAGILGLGILGWEIVRYFLGFNTVEGFTTISGLVSLFAGTQLITIGIMGEYVGRLFFRSMGKPMYLVSKELPSQNNWN